VAWRISNTQLAHYHAPGQTDAQLSPWHLQGLVK
jgi:hypothetical protein